MFEYEINIIVTFIVWKKLLFCEYYYYITILLLCEQNVGCLVDSACNF